MTDPSRWIFDKECLTLTLRWEDKEYEVNLERCTTSAKTLDWIMQVASKASITNHAVGLFVRELERLLDPQATMCSMGENKKPINVKKVNAGNTK